VPFQPSPRQLSNRRFIWIYPLVAANGHAHVVRTLTLHVAHADRADKHSVTPEMLAKNNRKGSTAEALRDSLKNKDKDLRLRCRGRVWAGKRAPRALWIPSRGNGFTSSSPFTTRLFNTLKAHSNSDPHSHTLAHSRRQL
jgi:hypothetical protein